MRAATSERGPVGELYAVGPREGRAGVLGSWGPGRGSRRGHCMQWARLLPARHQLESAHAPPLPVASTRSGLEGAAYIDPWCRQRVDFRIPIFEEQTSELICLSLKAAFPNIF